MKKLITLLYAVLAGVSIALGGTAYLSLDNKAVGALFFTLGLFIILTNGFCLFTGKVLYLFERPVSYLGDLGIIWVGNLIGAALVATMERATRLTAVVEQAQKVTAVKLGDGLLSVFFLAIFCNFLIFAAVDGFVRNERSLGKYIGLFFGVAGFIVCGFEHCVADMFFITVAGAWSGHAIVFLLVATAGNAVGGVVIPVCRKVKERAEKRETAGVR